MWFVMPAGLHRTYGAQHLHFITCSCYRRLPFLRTARARDRFLSALEQTREQYRFVVVGYVVMPEHVHLLLTEPEAGTVSAVIQVSKQQKPGPAASSAHWHRKSRPPPCRTNRDKGGATPKVDRTAKGWASP